MADGNGSIPLLGGNEEKDLPVITGFNTVTLSRRLDEMGGRRAKEIRSKGLNPQGQPIIEAVMGRDSFMDGDELLDAIREIVREELKNFLKAIRGEVDAI